MFTIFELKVNIIIISHHIHLIIIIVLMAMFTIFERKVILFTHFAIPLSPTLCEAGLTMNTGSAATIVMKEEEEMKEVEEEEERGKDKNADDDTIWEDVRGAGLWLVRFPNPLAFGSK